MLLDIVGWLFMAAIIVSVFGLAMGALGWALLPIIKLFGLDKRTPNKGQIEARANSIVFYIQGVNDNKAFPDIKTAMNMRPEEFALCDTAAELYEFQRKSYRTGGGMRVARGVYVGGSQSHSYETLDAVDAGRVIATNQRLLFLGDKKTTTIELGDILTLEEADGAVAIHSNKRTKPLLMSVKGFDAALLVLLLKLCTAGHFKSRFLPKGMELHPSTDGDGGIDVSVKYYQEEMTALP